MRQTAQVLAVTALLLLSACAAVTVVDTAVSVTATAVGTAVDVTAGVVEGGVDLMTDDDDEEE